MITKKQKIKSSRIHQHWAPPRKRKAVRVRPDDRDRCGHIWEWPTVQVKGERLVRNDVLKVCAKCHKQERR